MGLLSRLTASSDLLKSLPYVAQSDMDETICQSRVCALRDDEIWRRLRSLSKDIVFVVARHVTDHCR
jgi:hypothetical protein